MKKVFVILFLLIGLCAQGVVLKGGVHYTVESAREEAFSRVKYKISMDEHKKYLKDPGFSLDKNGKPKIRKFGRDVTFFEDGSYSVYHSSNDMSYYYNSNGTLYELSYSQGYDYPQLTVKYDINGKLTCVAFEMTREEAYMYSADKKYLGHWVKEKFYDSNGKFIMYRKY